MLNLTLSDITSNNSLLANRFLPSSSSLHPYIKGYFYVYFKFPNIVLKRVSNDADNAKLSNILLALCESYTPSGDRQIKYEDVVGLGDVSASFVTGQTVDRNFSLMYRELWKSPVLKIHRAWTSIIDPIYGGLVNYDNENFDFLPSTYKGSVLVIQTKPIALYSSDFKINKDSIKDYIVKVDLYTGVFPTTDLNSMYDANITDNSIVRPTVQYRFDGTKYDDTMSADLIDNAASILSNTILSTDNKMQASSLYTVN